MFYLCDPRLNVLCQKTCCYIKGGKCFITSDMNCAFEGTALEGDNVNRPVAGQMKIKDDINEDIEKYYKKLKNTFR